MSLLSGVTHLVGNVVTPLAEAGGAVTSLGGLAPNTLSNNLTTIGHNISNQGSDIQGFRRYAPVVGSDSGSLATPLDASGSANSYYTSSDGGGYAAPAINPNQSVIDLINASLGRLPGELQTAQANLQHQFDTKNNELQSGYDAANQQYGQSTLQNKQALQGNRNTIQDQAANGLQGLLRILGAHGAGGGSGVGLAQNAVAKSAAEQNAGAGQTYAQNQQGLDTNFNTFKTGFDNSKKQLNDWLAQQQQAAQATSNSNEQGLRAQLLQLSPTQAAAQSQVDAINNLRNAADGLQSFNPTYNGTTPTYNAPSLASYLASPNAISQTQSNVPGSVTPAIATLLGLNKDKQNQLSF